MPKRNPKGEYSLRIWLFERIHRQKVKDNPSALGTIEGDMLRKLEEEQQQLECQRQRGGCEHLHAASPAADDDRVMSDDDSPNTLLQYADGARSPPRLIREENVQDWVDKQVQNQAEAEDFNMEGVEEDQGPDQFPDIASTDHIRRTCPESPRLKDLADDFDASPSSSDEDAINYPPPPPGLRPPPGLPPPLAKWTPINAPEELGDFDSDYWGDGINLDPLASIEEQEPERVRRILPMVKHSLRLLAVQEREQQILPAIFRHRVYQRSSLGRETVLAEDRETGKTVTRYGVHFGRGIIGDWSRHDGFGEDWILNCRVCEEKYIMRGMGWALTRDSSTWGTDSERSPSTISFPTTVDDEEPLTEMENALLEGHLPDEMVLDPALKSSASHGEECSQQWFR